MIDEEEQPLTGGNASAGVVRVGSTVRKPWTRSTPAVLEYMGAVAAAGVDVPAPLGRDEQGRQIIEFVPGPLALHSPPLSLPDLTRVGGIVRAIHDASEGFEPGRPAHWEQPIPSPDTELICHGDLAPWNLIIGERWVFIDWDGAGPSTRLWDLAYSAQAFTLNEATAPPERAAEQLAAFIEGYGADAELRQRLPRATARRAWAMFDLLATSHLTGREPWASMYAGGHGEHWLTVARYVGRHDDVWTRALARAG